MSEWAPRRFWSAVTAEPHSDTGYQVCLDGRAIRTPAKRPILLPTKALAEAVASEWDAQEETLNPETMPYTRMVNAAFDKVTDKKSEVAEMIAAYGDADLLCYRAKTPDDLAARQAAAWDPMLDWASTALGVRLVPHCGVMHVPQDAAALASLHARVQSLDVLSLSGFHDLVSLSGSLVLGFATLLKARPTKELWDMSRIDETWQAERWGDDEEAQEHATKRQDAFLRAAQFCEMASAGA